jgi:hypothetical protein
MSGSCTRCRSRSLLTDTGDPALLLLLLLLLSTLPLLRLPGT